MKPGFLSSFSEDIIFIKVVVPIPIKRENRWQAIPPVTTTEAFPFLAMEIVVRPSGKALPMESTTIAKKDLEMLNTIPTKFSAETTISLMILFQRIPQNMLNITRRMKYQGFPLLVNGW